MAAAELEPLGIVRWGERIPSEKEGIYVVSEVASTAMCGVEPRPCPISMDAVESLLRVRSELTMDGLRPDADQLAKKFTEFWLPDEHVLYVGLAKNLSRRVRGYYSTPIGARRPHAGGWFLKMLRSYDRFYLHFAECDNRRFAEERMLGAFCAGISKASREALRDPAHPFPFANLEWPAGTRKAHGIKGAKAPKESGFRSGGEPQVRRTINASQPDLQSRSKGDLSGNEKATFTQRITDADIQAGRIRIPKRSKHLLPSHRGDILINLRGHRAEVKYDPRLKPQERSGVIHVGRKALSERVNIDEVLEIAVPSLDEVRLT